MPTPSFQNLLDDFSDENFVGRADRLALFDQAITTPRPSFLILDVSGQGEVGKTTLSEQFCHISCRHEVLAPLVNEGQLTVPAVLAELITQLTDTALRARFSRRATTKTMSSKTK